MLAEKYLLLLETLRKSLPDRSQAYPDGAPKVVSTSPHIPVKLQMSQPRQELDGRLARRTSGAPPSVQPS
jgi:hypothetical protein